jgi:hypothetical protein
MARLDARLERLERSRPQVDVRDTSVRDFLEAVDWEQYERDFMTALDELGIDGMLAEFARWQKEPAHEH